MIEQFLQNLTFDITDIIGLSLLFIFFLIQVFFYFSYYNKPYSYVKNKDNYDGYINKDKPKVSVIIVSENEVRHLEQNLPYILEQDYDDYEVIVVNNGSTDESEELLQSMKCINPHLYHTYLPYSNDKRFGRRKLALTIGVKAAKGDVLLFTEPYSKPISKQWISSMIKEMGDDKDVVLGYSYYKKTNKLYNLVARFDNHLFSMFYLAMAIKNKPFIGVYRNLAYRKNLFFDNKGFATHLHLENGEEAFINQIINKDNTAIALTHESFIETSLESFSLWKQIKKTYFSIKSHFNNKTYLIYDFEIFSRNIFYLLLFILIAYSIAFHHFIMGIVAGFLFLTRWLIQIIVLNKSSKYFYSGAFCCSIPLLDLLQPLYNLRFKSLISRNKKIKKL